MAFITTDELREYLASALRRADDHQDVSASSFWQPFLVAGVEWGYNEILSAMVARGYTKAQADTWRRGVEYNLSLGLYWTLTLGAGYHDLNDKWVARLDRRAELWEGVALDADGNMLVPEGDGGLIGRGDLGREDDLMRDHRTGVYRTF